MDVGVINTLRRQLRRYRAHGCDDSSCDDTLEAVATIFTHGVVMGVRRNDDVVKGRQRFEVGENVTPRHFVSAFGETGAPVSVW